MTADIGNAIEDAAEHLPDGWNLSVDVEHKAAVVLLWDDDGDQVDCTEYQSDFGLADEIRNAVALARARAGDVSG